MVFQIQKIKAACGAVNGGNTVVKAADTITPDKVAAWGSIAKEFGSAIGSMAKELGVQVNDFLRTPAGVLITLYLFWSKLGGVVIGIPFVLAVWALYFKLWDRFRRTPVEFENRPIIFGIFNRQLVTRYDYNYEHDSVAVYATLVGAVMIIITAFIIGCVIL